MKRFIILAVIMAAFGCSSEEPDDPIIPDPSGEIIVSMPGFSFAPFTTTVLVGGKVVFDFPFEPHNVIFARITGAPTDIQVVTNTKVSRTFPVAGRFPYDCTIHPGMSGVIQVNAPTS